MTIEIKDGKVYGFKCGLSFTSTNATGDKRNVNCNWDFDGMTVEDFCNLAWSNFKVVVQRTTLKKMSNKDIEALKGKTLKAVDYLEAKNSNATAQVMELQAKIEAMQKQFIELAMNEAIAELGVEAGNDALGNRGMEIYRTKYEPIVAATN